MLVALCRGVYQAAPLSVTKNDHDNSLVMAVQTGCKLLRKQTRLGQNGGGSLTLHDLEPAAMKLFFQRCVSTSQPPRTVLSPLLNESPTSTPPTTLVAVGGGDTPVAETPTPSPPTRSPPTCSPPTRSTQHGSQPIESRPIALLRTSTSPPLPVLCCASRVELLKVKCNLAVEQQTAATYLSEKNDLRDRLKAAEAAYHQDTKRLQRDLEGICCVHRVQF